MVVPCKPEGIPQGSMARRDSLDRAMGSKLVRRFARKGCSAWRLGVEPGAIRSAGRGIRGPRWGLARMGCSEWRPRGGPGAIRSAGARVSSLQVWFALPGRGLRASQCDSFGRGDEFRGALGGTKNCFLTNSSDALVKLAVQAFRSRRSRMLEAAWALCGLLGRRGCLVTRSR